MRQTTKRRIVLILLLSVVLTAGSCADQTGTEDKTSEETTRNAPQTGETGRGAADGVLFFNEFCSVGEPPFALPDAEEAPDGNDRYSYTGVPRAYYESFLSGLETAGFSLHSMKYSDFLIRGDCMIFSQYNEEDGFFSVSWYRKSPFAPQNGISEEAAAERLMPDRETGLSKLPLCPVDVTPEGFFERTGGQIFAVPYYSFDVFKSLGQESLMFADNEHYSCAVCYVTGTDAYVTSMERVAVCDLDGDGGDEVLLLSYGPTSGLFTFDVMCVSSRGVYDTIFNTEFYRLRFIDKNGTVVLEGVGSNGVSHTFDVSLEQRGGETIVMLYENGKRLQTWGSPNTGNETGRTGTEERKQGRE